MTAKGTTPLTYTERKIIEEGLRKGLSTTQIASILKRSVNPIKVEIRINGGKESYNAEKGQTAANGRKKTRFEKISWSPTEEQRKFIAEALDKKIPLMKISEHTGIRRQTLWKLVAKEFPTYKKKASWALYERVDHLENLVECLQQQIEIIFDTIKEMKNGKD